MITNFDLIKFERKYDSWKEHKHIKTTFQVSRNLLRPEKK